MEERQHNSIGRAAIVVIVLIIQLAWILHHVYRIDNYYPMTITIGKIISVLIVLRIYGSHTNAAVKIPWMVLLLVMPITGLILYLLFKSKWSTYFTKKKFRNIVGKMITYLKNSDDLLGRLKEQDPTIYGQSRYISHIGAYPVYDGCKVDYYAEASDGIEAQKEDMRKAEKFIFMEYHAIEDSKSFQEIEDILAEKVKEGVDVRVIYDDFGSMGFVNKAFRDKLNAKGIKCVIFNPMVPIINVFMNNRDHRKITVIDGKIGYTGGYNIADRYFNINSPYGHWKDTGIRIQGQAVDTLTVLFLEMWYAVCRQDMKREYVDKFTGYAQKYEDEGIVQPYAESPLKEEMLAETVYLNLAKNAKDYLYIMTPYLLIDDNINDELVQAAKRGVDVRIITPGIPDKKFVYSMTRSYYGALVRGGVRIYEYTPGFVHAKQHLSDDTTAVIGTINMDYRSLYLHFENGVLLHKVDAIKDIKKDFEETLEKSREVTNRYNVHNRSLGMRVRQCLLRFFAPLM